jgi:hypothetical protein
MTIAHLREGGAVVFVNTTVDHGPDGAIARCLSTGAERDLSASDLVEHFPCHEAEEMHRKHTRTVSDVLMLELLTSDQRYVWLRRRLIGVCEEELPDGSWAYYDTNGDTRVIIRPPYRFWVEARWPAEEEIQF